MPGSRRPCREEFVDAGFDRAVLREAYPHESFGPYLRSFDEFREFVNLFAGIACASRRDDAADVFRRIEDCESPAAGPVAEVVYLHAETDIRLVRAVTGHRLAPRYTREGTAELDAERLAEQVLGEPFEDFEHVFLFDERHLAVYLGEFRLAVGPQVLIAEAAYDLEIAVVAGDHQQLLESLRRLRQGVEFAGIHARGDHEVAGPFRRGADEERRLYFEEAFSVEKTAGALGHAVAQQDVALQGWPAQVEITVFHAEFVAAVAVLLDGEGGYLGPVEDGERRDGYFDVARRYLGIFRGAFTYRARRLYDIFTPQPGRSCTYLGRRVFVHDELRNAVTVAQVDEGHCAEVSHFLYPSGECRARAGIVDAEFSARMRPVHIMEFLVALHHQYKTPDCVLLRAAVAPHDRLYYICGVSKVRNFMEKGRQEDEFFMRAAISEARKALNEEEVPIGAVVVASGRIVGRGHNLVETLRDSTAHAEMQALTAAMHAAGGKYLNECTLYVTVEPCVMCAGAAAWAQVGRIVYGTSDAKRGYSAAGGKLLHPKTQVTAGVLAGECAALMEDFFKKLRR